jgi:ribonuclease HI
MVIYQNWLARNEAMEDVKIEDPQSIARRSIHLVDEWANSRTVSLSEAHRVTEAWLPPAAGWLKANADGAFLKESETDGCGVVIRDHHGEFLLGASRFLRSVSDPERAELLACKLALELARDRRVEKICLESDCLAAITKLRSNDMDRSIHGPLVEEIKDLLKSFGEFSVCHSRRSSNGVAHCLAQVGCMNKICNTWMDHPPGLIVNLLAQEGAG